MLKAFGSVREKQRNAGLSDEELKNVQIDEGWIDWKLLQIAEKRKKKPGSK